MTPPAPLLTHTGIAPPEWMDYNGHLMDGYYLVAFTDATEGFLDYLGFGPQYRERTGCTIYTVEGHINFLREVKAGARLTYTTQVFDCDAKRLHVFHVMRLDDDEPAATNELMLLHVNQRILKVEPMPPANLERAMALYQTHCALPRPPQAGRIIAIPKRNRS
jgi:acyl-CoA thioester hydrolase